MLGVGRLDKGVILKNVGLADCNPSSLPDRELQSGTVWQTVPDRQVAVW